MKTYRGVRFDDNDCAVRVHEAGPEESEVHVNELDVAWSLKVRNHSPTGFEWGYAGSGPAQLALAMLLDALNDGARSKEECETIAVKHYQDWKMYFLAGANKDTWTCSHEAILMWLSGRE